MRSPSEIEAYSHRHCGQGLDSPAARRGLLSRLISGISLFSGDVYGLERDRPSSPSLREWSSSIYSERGQSLQDGAGLRHCRSDKYTDGEDVSRSDERALPSAAGSTGPSNALAGMVAMFESAYRGCGWWTNPSPVCNGRSACLERSSASQRTSETWLRNCPSVRKRCSKAIGASRWILSMRQIDSQIDRNSVFGFPGSR